MTTKVPPPFTLRKLFQITTLLVLGGAPGAHAFLLEPPPKLLQCELALSPQLATFANPDPAAREAIDDLRRRVGEGPIRTRLNEVAADLARPPTPGRVVRAMVIRGSRVRPAIEAFTRQTERLNTTYAELRRTQRTLRRVLEKAVGGVFVIPKIDLLFFHLPELLIRDGWRSFQIPETLHLLVYSPVMVAGLALVATVEFARAMHFDSNSRALPQDLARLNDGLLTIPQIHSTEVALRSDVAGELRGHGLHPDTRAAAYAGLRRTWVGLAAKAFMANLQDESLFDSVGDLDHVTIDHVLYEDEGEPVWVVVTRFARQEAKMPRIKPVRRVRKPSAPVGWPQPA